MMESPRDGWWCRSHLKTVKMVNFMLPYFATIEERKVETPFPLLTQTTRYQGGSLAPVSLVERTSPAPGVHRSDIPSQAPPGLAFPSRSQPISPSPIPELRLSSVMRTALGCCPRARECLLGMNPSRGRWASHCPGRRPSLGQGVLFPNSSAVLKTQKPNLTLTQHHHLTLDHVRVQRLWQQHSLQQLPSAPGTSREQAL